LSIERKNKSLNRSAEKEEENDKALFARASARKCQTKGHWHTCNFNRSSSSIFINIAFAKHADAKKDF